MHPEEWSHLLALEGQLRVHTSETQQGSWMNRSDVHYHLRETLVSGDWTKHFLLSFDFEMEELFKIANNMAVTPKNPGLLSSTTKGHLVTGPLANLSAGLMLLNFNLTELLAEDDISINLVSIWSSTPTLKADGCAQTINLANDIVHEPDAQLQLCRADDELVSEATWLSLCVGQDLTVSKVEKSNHGGVDPTEQYVHPNAHETKSGRLQSECNVIHHAHQELPCLIAQCMERRTQHSTLIRIVNRRWRSWTTKLVCSIRVCTNILSKTLVNSDTVMILRHLQHELRSRKSRKT